MGRRGVVRTLLGVAMLPLFVAIAVNAATGTSFPGPLRLIQAHPWWSVLVGPVGAGAYAVWELRTRPGQAEIRLWRPVARPRRRSP